MDITTFMRAAQPIVQLVAGVPWDRFVQEKPLPLPSSMVPTELLGKRLTVGPAAQAPTETAPAAAPAKAQEHRSVLAKPGCTAADESGVVLYHLEGLAGGKKGFGVLATDVERLERAAKGAEGMGDRETAGRLRTLAGQLPEVRDSEKAKEVAEELRPIADVAWELGRRCGGHDVTPELKAKAQSLAQHMKAALTTTEPEEAPSV